MNNQIKREFVYFTDDEADAYIEMNARICEGEKGLTVAAVRHMTNPPNTIHKYVIVKVTEF